MGPCRDGVSCVMFGHVVGWGHPDASPRLLPPSCRAPRPEGQRRKACLTGVSGSEIPGGSHRPFISLGTLTVK